MRQTVQSLDATWHVARDPENVGREQEWFQRDGFPERVPVRVPGFFNPVLPEYHGLVWYEHVFDAAVAAAPEEIVELRFTAVDHVAWVWLNGTFLGDHEDADEPFGFDVTDILRERDNRLVVRVLNPVDTEIDGYTLGQTSHSSKVNEPYTPGRGMNTGGIIKSVELAVTPRVAVLDSYVRTDIRTGRATLLLTVRNLTEEPSRLDLDLHVHHWADGAPAASDRFHAVVAPGTHEVEHTVHVPEHKLWDTEVPHLYVAHVAYSDGRHSGTWQQRFGFRELRIENGFFTLNGRRLLLRSAHTGNHEPWTPISAEDTELARRDLLYAKALGFNTIRFIAGFGLEAQLDLCDEIGLMVYDECHASWGMQEGPHMAERFDKPTLYMARRDRSHPSVTILGLLNETRSGAVSDHAVALLPRLREVAPDTLVLLSSGRWDGRPAVGSYANPGSVDWEHGWGGERPDHPETHAIAWDTPLAPSVPEMGDQHIYPRYPQSQEVTDALLTMMAGSKPFLVSEYGHGSQCNAIAEYQKYLEHGVPTTGEDGLLYKHMVDSFLAGLDKYGMDGIYPFPVDYLDASLAAQRRVRELNFDCLRSNPLVNGYNVTGLLDHSYTGEGLWTLWRELKPGIADTLRDGWAPLRWAIFLDRPVAYPGEDLRVRIFLANEDVLAPGRYPTTVRLVQQGRVVWERRLDLEIPEQGYGGLPPLSVLVMDEHVPVPLDPGSCTVAVAIDDGAIPRGGRRELLVHRPAGPSAPVTVTGVGLDAAGLAVLAAHGVTVRSLEEEPADVVLVGRPGPGPGTAALVDRLTELAHAGATVVYLCPEVFAEGDDGGALLPLADKGTPREHHGTLYHAEVYVKPHPALRALPPGMVDAELLGPVYPHWLFEDIGAPDLTLAATYGLGLPRRGGYVEGVDLGEYALGRGRMVLNTFRLLENAGTHPLADALMLGLVGHYTGSA